MPHRSYLAGFVAAGKLSLCEKMQQALQKMPSYSTADAAEYLSNLRRHVCFYQVGDQPQSNVYECIAMT